METKRLLLEHLNKDATDFIFELVNTQEWIQFIGDRAIKTSDDAKKYIQTIIENPDTQWWVLKLKRDKRLIGVVTFTKRDYLEYPDIGFALLSPFSKQGYMYEATKTILDKLKEDKIYNNKIIAITLKENDSSIRLLRKLGLVYDKEITIDEEQFLLYTI